MIKKTFKHKMLDELYHLKHEAIDRYKRRNSSPLQEEDIYGPELEGIIGEIDRSIAVIITTPEK